MDEWVKLVSGEIISIEEFLIRQLPVKEQAERRQQVALAEAWAEELWLEREFPDGIFSELDGLEWIDRED